MAAGFLYQSQCFSTLEAATAAHWSEKPADITPGSTSYISNVVWSGAVWQIKKYTLSSGGVLTNNSTTTLPALTFPACDTTINFYDGMALGWGVVGCIIAAFVIRSLRLGL